jgi:hypothetical protein
METGLGMELDPAPVLDLLDLGLDPETERGPEPGRAQA